MYSQEVCKVDGSIDLLEDRKAPQRDLNKLNSCQSYDIQQG